MRFEKFEIENFKGVQKAVLDLTKAHSGNVFTLVGLNESGKTTLLEAINSFSPDTEGVETLYKDVTRRTNYQDLIPKDKKANFTGSVIIRAHVRLDKNDRKKIHDFCKNELSYKIDLATFPDQFRITKEHKFKDSRYIETKNLWDIRFKLKILPRGKVFRYFSSTTDEWQSIVEYIKFLFPRICYFPTFLFDFPERIYLSNSPDESAVNAYYVQIVQDILDSLGDDLEIDRHIIKRVERETSPSLPWDPFKFFKSDEKQQIDHVMLKIGDQVTSIVFDRWNEIFGVKLKNKIIDVEWQVEKYTDTEEISVYLKFWIKDGKSKFDLIEKSLGFRWFFCFLLFTHFRISRKDSGALFLFDEPASNLHSKAQEQLLKSFSNISKNNNMIIYSTHSHYMIEPKWLEGAFIVVNDAIDYDEGIETQSVKQEQAISKQAQATNIHLDRYRNFVGQNPGKLTHFQPILDRLDFTPSKLEFGDSSVFFEGKHDFYAFEYFRRIKFKGAQNIRLFPSVGANDIGPLISLYLGWGRNFVIILDDDSAGRRAKQRYIDEWLLDEERCFTLGDISPDFSDKKLEGLITAEGRKFISEELNKSTLTKKDIVRFFQENFANERSVNFDSKTEKNFKTVLEFCTQQIAKPALS